jgi:hypothetical protein
MAPGRMRTLGHVMIVATCAHMLVGQFGWYARYETYIIVPVALLVLVYWIERPPFALHAKLAASGPAPVLLLCFAMFPHLWALCTVPLASRNIYEQQYQLHRLLTEAFPYPVAVNDLGLTSFRNDRYVLDVYGLGNEEIRRTLQQAAASTVVRQTTARLARQHGVRAALVLRAMRSRVPEEWPLVAQLHSRPPRITASASDVDVYAAGPENESALTAALRSFEPTLPPGTTLTWCAPPSHCSP